MGTRGALRWTVFTLFCNFFTHGFPPPPSYDPFHAGVVHRHTNRNRCAYVVHKNISCAVRGGVESFQEPVAAPCPPYVTNCPHQVTYKTRFRPTYKMAHKKVTELEWRCCPGYQGPGCTDLKPTPQHHIPVQGTQPYGPSSSGYSNRHTQRAERRETGHRETDDKVRLLEGQVERLSRTVLDLQSALKGLGADLRADLREDTETMLMTLFNNMRPPDGAAVPGPEDGPAVLDGHQASRGGLAGDRVLGKIEGRLDDIDDILKSKEELLEDLRGSVTSHEGQIRVLMDASQSQAPAVMELDVVQGYIDGKVEKLKDQLERTTRERADEILAACDSKIRTSQKTREDGRDKAADNKEADLREEIRAPRADMTVADGPSRTQRQTDPAKKQEDRKDVWLAIERIKEAYRVLNARIDNELIRLSEPREDADRSAPLMEELEARLNVTEQNAEIHCFYVEEKLTRIIAEEAASLRQVVDERLDAMEDQFTGMLVEMSNNSFPGAYGDSVDAVRAQVDNNKFLLRGLDDKINAVGELCSAGCSGSETTVAEGSSSPSPEGPDIIRKDPRRHGDDLDALRADVGANTDELRRLLETVQRESAGNAGRSESAERFRKELSDTRDRVAGLAGAVAGLSDSLSEHERDVLQINATCCRAETSGPGRLAPDAAGR
uniref:Elastin microfibril interfacer 2a n=1 Tax=Hippocampus comes TaxID=109280 RepID=A0A3Q2XW36_HIPCM